MPAQHPQKNKLYRKCVGIMLLNNDNQIFTAKRIDVSENAWQMPQGGIDDNENPIDAALRELKEEIGTNHVKLLAETDQWLTYDFPESLGPRLWNGQYRGQRQKWFAFRFLGQDSDINLETKTPEFTDWRWTHVNDLLDYVIDFKKETYRALIQELFSKVKK